MTPLRSMMIAALGLLLSCATPFQLIPGPPGATGTVKTGVGKNGNTNLAIRVQHLPPPGKIQADSTIYVVWVTPRGSAPQNVGALMVNNDYEGELNTATTQTQFQLIITPEPSAKVTQPTHDPVFTTQIEKR